MIELCSVSARWGAQAVLRDVSHRVAKGSWCCVVGANGAGKSTLLRVLAGLHRHSGSLQIDGAEVSQLRPRQRAKRVAFVPQTPLVPPGMTIAEYTMLGRMPHVSPLGRESDRDRAIVKEVLVSLDLESFARRQVTKVSGGELQRVVLSRALAQRTDVLVLDEPTSALDLGHQQAVLELIDRLRVDHHLTVVSAMHDLTLAGQYADEIVLLAAGEVVSSGPPTTVFAARSLEAHYNASLEVLRTETGHVVVPRRRTVQAPPPV